MYTTQDLDRLTARVRRLWDTDPQAIAADPKPVDELRAAWAEASALVASLIPMAFSECEPPGPFDSRADAGAGRADRWAGGLRRVYRSAREASLDTSSLGPAKDDPMAWLVMAMALDYRTTVKLRTVNELVLNMGGQRS